MKLGIFLSISFLLPLAAMADDGDLAASMYYQDQMHQRQLREAQDDRDMFNMLTTSFGGSNYGESYARKYGCEQAKVMFFGAKVQGCDARPRQVQENRVAAARSVRHATIVQNNAISPLILQGIKPRHAATPTPLLSSAALNTVINGAVEPVTPDAKIEASLEPSSNMTKAEASESLPIRKKAAPVHHRIVHHYNSDPDTNPDEDAWRAAHGY